MPFLCISLSTSTNLVIFVEYLSKQVDSRCSVYAIYTDFSKTFDKVHHELLFIKLNRFGITGNLLNWIKTYLCGRESVVVVYEYMSDHLKIHSGVPQGNLLHPIFFNIFITDLPLVILNSKCLLFANDLKFIGVLIILLISLLQIGLEKLSRWCNYNGMLLDVNKCFAFRFTSKKKSFARTYNVNGYKLQNVKGSWNNY